MPSFTHGGKGHIEVLTGLNGLVVRAGIEDPICPPVGNTIDHAVEEDEEEEEEEGEEEEEDQQVRERGAAMTRHIGLLSPSALFVCALFVCNISSSSSSSSYYYYYYYYCYYYLLLLLLLLLQLQLLLPLLLLLYYYLLCGMKAKTIAKDTTNTQGHHPVLLPQPAHPNGERVAEEDIHPWPCMMLEHDDGIIPQHIKIQCLLQCDVLGGNLEANPSHMSKEEASIDGVRVGIGVLPFMVDHVMTSPHEATHLTGDGAEHDGHDAER